MTGVLLRYCICLTTLFVPAGCSEEERPRDPRQDTAEFEMSDTPDDSPGPECPSPGEPFYGSLVIRVVSAPPIGIDAVVLAHECSGDLRYGAFLDYYNEFSKPLSASDIEATIGPPDAEPGACDGRYLVVGEGDVVSIRLQDFFEAGDSVEVVVVEPDGTCSSSRNSAQLMLSIAKSGLGSEVPIGRGNTAVVPLRNQFGDFVPWSE